MKKLFFTFITLLIVFFSAWGIKLRMPINRPNNVQGEQQVAWYETRYTAPTAEEEWTLDPEISVDISHILGNLITVIFDYQILRKPLKILSL